MKILFLDDRDERVRNFLAKSGGKGLVVRSAPEAIAALQEGRFDLVFLDHDLNDQSHVAEEERGANHGQAVVDWIVENRPAVTRFIVHSTNTTQARLMRDKIRDAGFSVSRLPFEEYGWTTELESGNMLDQVNEAADHCRTLAYPGGFDGRGVVIGAGGEKFFRDAWVCFSMLRWLGCTLPVQFWHLGRGEMDPAMQSAAESVGISVIDGRALWESLPEDERPAILNGWELKPFSVLHSPFREVLYLDADCVPVTDPTYLFDEPEYRQHGSIFWPDLPPSKRKEWLPATCWANVGLEYRDEPDFESGQFVIDKSKCWSELQFTVWMNGRSDYFYQFVYGDKSTYHLAWRKLDRDYAMPATPAGWRKPAILQHDLRGRLIFEHCCQGKEKLAAGERINGLKHANQCVDAARVLQLSWPHRIWDRATETPEERAAGDALANFGYRYNRIGFGERPMELRIDGTIGEGAAACEKRWSYRILDGIPTIVIVGEAHKGSEVGMMFLTKSAGVWRGDWEYHERGPVELHPPPPSQPPRWFTCRPNTWDRDIWDCVVRDNEYRLPDQFDPGAVVLDIGAHIGSFAFACLERGATVHAVEAAPDNYAVLTSNLARFDRAVCYHAAAWSNHEPLRKVRLSLPEGHPNTGGWRVADQGQQETLAIPFDLFVDAALAKPVNPDWPDEGRPVTLLKLDCEGAEWPILATSQRLHLIDAICGEWHLESEAERGRLLEMKALLRDAGFQVEIEGDGTIGHFWAEQIAAAVSLFDLTRTRTAPSGA